MEHQLSVVREDVADSERDTKQELETERQDIKRLTAAMVAQEAEIARLSAAMMVKEAENARLSAAMAAQEAEIARLSTTAVQAAPKPSLASEEEGATAADEQNKGDDDRQREGLEFEQVCRLQAVVRMFLSTRRVMHFRRLVNIQKKLARRYTAKKAENKALKGSIQDVIAEYKRLEESELFFVL
jgi:hypothetical protein